MVSGVPISKKDRVILREVAKQVAEIAADPAQADNIDLWKRLKRLEGPGL